MSNTSKTPLSVEQAATFTGYSKAYLYKLIHLGKIPYYKPSNGKQSKVFLCKEELEDFIFSNCGKTNGGKHE